MSNRIKKFASWFIPTVAYLVFAICIGINGYATPLQAGILAMFAFYIGVYLGEND